MLVSKKRAGVVIATVCIQLIIGIAYIWSAFQGGVSRGLFGGNNALAGLTFSLLLASLTIASVFGGKLVARFSVRAVVIAGGIMVAIGFFSAAFVTEGTRWLLWLTYGVIGGAGMGFTYTPSIACAQRWFPHKRGLITGIVVAALGLGTVLFAPVVEVMISSFYGIAPNIVGITTGESLTFMVLAGIFLVVCVIGGIFMKNPPEGYADFIATQQKEKIKLAQAAESKAQSDSEIQLEQQQEEETLAAIELAQINEVAIDLDIITSSESSEKLNNDTIEDHNITLTEEGYCPANAPSVYGYHHSKRIKIREFPTRNLNAKQMLKSGYYYLITVAMLLAVISGLMVINFARPIAVLRGFESVAFVAVLAVGLSNSAGRILWGAISDKLGRLNTLLILLGATALFAPFIAIVPGAGVFVFIALIGLCYGGILAIFPALTAEIFGVKNLATNYGFILLGFGIGAIVASQIAGVFANNAIQYQDVGRMLPAFLIAMACAFTSGMLIMTVKIMNSRKKIRLFIRALGDKWKTRKTKKAEKKTAQQAQNSLEE